MKINYVFFSRFFRRKNSKGDIKMAETKQSQRKLLLEKLAEIYKTDVCYGKGGFFIRGNGWISFSQARKITTIEVPEELKRENGKVLSYGDYATIAGINGRMNG